MEEGTDPAAWDAAIRNWLYGQDGDGVPSASLPPARVGVPA
jgi:3-hydroxybenzoate 6-monooxygenase